ncbi:MAG: calcium/sodium antiporter [Puniceicoccales bacterium]|jgi:cation:H+ antiporter|nr:calcium/sodium antiporter [Puniceicoccales bacterium]
MDMWEIVFFTVLGFILLAYGGDFVCRGASAMAIHFGISQFVIGMTIVAISTSAPELVTSLIATLDRHPEIVVGNVIGSNLVNIGLAGGLVALIKPFTITSHIIKIEIPFLCFITGYFGICAILIPIEFHLGIIFIAINVLYLYFICKKDRCENEEENVNSKISLEIDLEKALSLFIFGLLLLFSGAQLVINASVKIAHALGWSDALIGFTIVAVGTSFPEIVISLVAALRGHGAICTGNIIGSNIFNSLMITGSCALIHPIPVSTELCRTSIPFLVFLTILMGCFFVTRRKINRLEGLVLFVVFICAFSFSIYSEGRAFWAAFPNGNSKGVQPLKFLQR